MIEKKEFRPISRMILSVSLGLLVGLMYVVVMAVITTPFLLLIRMGLLGVANSTFDLRGLMSNLAGPMKNIIGPMDTLTIVVLVIQSLLFIGLGIVSFLFMTKMMRVFFPKENGAYFRHLYDGLFLVLMIVPEILIVLSVFCKLPIYITLWIIGGITTLMTTLVTIMVSKILPDLKKNEDKQYLMDNSVVK